MQQSSTSFKNVAHNTASSAPINSNSNNDGHELQFYDPTAILGVSRELAFGYLILLSGGAVEYESPAPPQDLSITGQKSVTAAPTMLLDMEASSLAYAAITDGNVLHACFGLKATANGRSTVPTIGGKQPKTSSIFCCFPFGPTSATLDALHLLLPHLTKNKNRVQTLIEILSEVREWHDEEVYASGVAETYVSAGSMTDGIGKVPLHLRVIHAYVRCFTSIVRYHDSREVLRTYDVKASEPGRGIMAICSKWFVKPKIDPKLELLRSAALVEISTGFRGLKEDIWEGLENMANKSAFTTGMSSVEGSAVGSILSGGKR